jgi:acyl-CoA synthetase (AMP-forming)/AMP-acid ligase II/acyl carrier protein
MVDRFASLSTQVALENIYGPTEATIYSSGYSTRNLKGALKVPIGKPLDNVNLYVLGQGNHLQPIGVPGELCIGGRALARGYLHNPELTAEKFIHVAALSEERIYKTGDLVRWQPDGNMEYLGRMDNQVKLRGFRIELGEIESQLSKIHNVEQSIVELKEKEGDKYLVAYYQSVKEIDPAELKRRLSEKLPAYMLPSYYVHMESFPLTSSGKLSKKNLPDPEIKKEEDYMAPSNEIEEKLVTIWSEVLKLDKELISVNRSFFELGGHSLKAMVLVNKIAKELEMTLPLEQIFEQSTIKKQGTFIEINRWLDDDTSAESEEKMTERIII